MTEAPVRASRRRREEPFPRQSAPWMWAFIVVVSGFFRLLSRWRVEGRENIPHSGAVIFASNHLSHLDPPLLGVSLLPRWCLMMAKEELFHVPVLSYILRRVGVYPIRRGEGDLWALRCTLQLLKEGKAVCIFPEGHRSPNGELQPPEPGIALLASRSRAAVVPVCVEGSHTMLPPGSRRLRPLQRLTVRIGPAINADDLPARPSRGEMQAFAERVMAAIARLQSEIRASK